MRSLSSSWLLGAALLVPLVVASCGDVQPVAIDRGTPPDAGVVEAEDSGITIDDSDAGIITPGKDATTVEPDVDSLAWTSDATTGLGVSVKDTMNPLGTNTMIVYAGFNIETPAARAWATALYRAQFRNRGVKYIFAVQGPADSTYAGLEIGNSKIAAALVANTGATTKFIAVLAHSSGSFVAHELLNQLTNGSDPGDVTKGKVVYYNMEGDSISGTRGVSTAVVNRLRKAYFVSGHDGALLAPNHSPMQNLGATYGTFIDLDMAGSGCAGGSSWCVHVSLVNEKPFGNASPDKATANEDYSTFNAAHPVNVRVIVSTAVAAGLDP